MILKTVIMIFILAHFLNRDFDFKSAFIRWFYWRHGISIKAFVRSGWTRDCQ